MVQNELHFLTWAAFRQMAPAIVRLEIRRLGRVLPRHVDEPAFYEGLVRARYELNRFVETLPVAGAEADCTRHLEAALLALSMLPGAPEAGPGPTLARSGSGPADELDAEQLEDALEADLAATVRYTLGRLTYVHDRVPLLYT